VDNELTPEEEARDKVVDKPVHDDGLLFGWFVVEVLGDGLLLCDGLGHDEGRAF